MSGSFALLSYLVASIAYFVIGWLWYTPLFGKVWAKETGISMGVVPGGGAMAAMMRGTIPLQETMPGTP